MRCENKILDSGAYFCLGQRIVVRCSGDAEWIDPPNDFIC